MLGSLKEFRSDSLGFLTDSVRRYGDFVRFRFGYIVAHLLNRPEYAEHVLVKQARYFDKHTRSVSKLRATCGSSLLSSDGEAWLKHRRLMQPVFQPRMFDEFVTVIDRVVDARVESWVSSSEHRTEVDLVTEMMGLTMTIAAELFFTSSVEDQTESIENALSTILQDTWRRLESPIDMADLSPRFHRRTFRDAIATIDSIVNEIIRHRTDSLNEGNSQPNDLLARLLSANRGDSPSQLSDQELRDAVVTLLLAGHETTANALVNAFFLVSKNPLVADGLRQEAQQIDPDERVPPLAKRVFAETLRLYPSIWIIERRVIVDHDIGDYHLPAGSTVLVSPYLLHRHDAFWDSPERFDPSRFDLEKSEQFPNSSYIPFGRGPHRCIGEHLALLVGTRVLSRFYRSLDLSTAPQQQLNLHPGITLRHQGELKVAIRRS